MLKTRLMQAFALLVLLLGVLSAATGVHILRSRVVAEAQTRVRLDLSSAWAVYHAELDKIGVVLRLVAQKKIVVEAGQAQQWGTEEVRTRLEGIRRNFGLDFLVVVSPEGRVVLRVQQPARTGDDLGARPMVAGALKGETVLGTALLSAEELAQEDEALAARAFVALEATPRARPTTRKEENRGLVMAGAVPIVEGGRQLAVLYGGTLLNGNATLVDRIQDVIFGAEGREGAPRGTATVFLHDSRIATTVRLSNGHRAIGTRVSEEVADQVLDRGLPWVDRAFVVRDWYLTAYEPIRDGAGHVIGMLYVGILEKPFKDLERDVLARFALLSVFGLAAALGLAYFMASRLAGPIHQLVQAAERMKHGEAAGEVRARTSCHEIEALVAAFNDMTRSLAEREARLREANAELGRANEALRDLNRRYMETVGFVAHELKNPLASILNYTHALRHGPDGAGRTPEQDRALAGIERGGHRLLEMIRHYLSLSRIENGELQPVRTRVRARELIDPLAEELAADLGARAMTLAVRVPDGLELDADPSLAGEVFENLLSNAVKYGREGTEVRLTGERQGAVAAFAVRNEGEGIPPDKTEAVFGKFVRLAGAEGGPRPKGTGLGLFIAKMIVEAHGGRITVESHPGAWTEFRFTLPAADA